MDLVLGRQKCQSELFEPAALDVAASFVHLE
jgi:hypothetical protein